MTQNLKVGLRLTSELRHKLDTVAKSKGVNVSKFIRSALEREFANNAH